MTTELTAPITAKFSCEPCAFCCSQLSDWSRHLLTRKHNNNLQMQHFTCDCGRKYTHRASLFNHKKKCPSGTYAVVVSPAENVPENVPVSAPYIELLIKENLDLKLIMLDMVKSNNDLQKQMLEVCNKGQQNLTISNSNNNNQTFNLQFFLNEQCKDAMNLSEFVESFTLQLSDLESVGKMGYVDGISNIIIKRLRTMDVFRRPIHCSDAKREILHVKDNDVWERESADNPRLREAIQVLTKKNRKLLLDWRDEHPESWQINNSYNDHYMILINQAMGGKGTQEESETRMIKQIAREVVIGKK